MVAGGALAILGGGVALGPLARPTPTVALGPPRFIDDTASSGVAHTYAGPFPFSVGGGVATFDCNGDGRPDLYLAGGSGPAALYRNDSSVGGPLRFTKVADPATDLTGVTGAYPIDLDGDGKVDLMVLRDGENVALRGLGGCRFERANAAWGLDGGASFTTAFSATWEGPAALPTLAFGNYVADPQNPDPNHLCADNELIRPVAGTGRYGAPIPFDAVLVRLVDVVQRLGPVRSTRSSGQQRPPLLQRPERRTGAALADRTRPAAPSVHGG